MPTTTNDEHLLARQAEGTSRYIELALARYTHLTPAQAQRLGAAMWAEYHTPSESNDCNAVYFDALVKNRPDLVRKAPTVHQAFDFLCKAGGITSEPARLTEWRKIEKLDSDALMRLVPHDAKLSDAPAPITNSPPPAPALTAAQKANKWTESDAILAQRGFNPDTMDVHKRIEYRRVIEKERAPPSMRFVNEALAMIAAGKAWSQLSWTVQRTAHDQAKAAGKTLVELGIDITK